MKQITLEELRSVQYFHEHKGDITRMCDWPQVLAKIKKQDLRLWEAWANRQEAALRLASRDHSFLTLLQERIDALDLE